MTTRVYIHNIVDFSRNVEFLPAQLCRMVEGEPGEEEEMQLNEHPDISEPEDNPANTPPDGTCNSYLILHHPPSSPHDTFTTEIIVS